MKMKSASTFCLVMLIVATLAAASAGIFACEIDCAIAPTPQPMGHAESCGGHAHMPGHAPANDSRGQRTGHSHNRIIAAAHVSVQRTTLQQTGILPQASGGSAMDRLNYFQGNEFATAKPPSLIFTTPVLRI
jgi:hypothetical protein